MTSEARSGRARTVLGMAPMKFLAGAAAFASRRCWPPAPTRTHRTPMAVLPSTVPWRQGIPRQQRCCVAPAAVDRHALRRRSRDSNRDNSRAGMVTHMTCISTALLAVGCLTLLPDTHAEGVTEIDCPDVLVNDVGDAAASCVLVSEGTLVSTLGNADVFYRTYSWLTPDDVGLSIGRLDDHAAEVADGVAVGRGYFSRPNLLTLALADDPKRVLWWLYLEKLYGWVLGPRIVRSPEYGEFLIVERVWYGTAGITDEFEFLGRGAWIPVIRDYHRALKALLPEDDDYWIREGPLGLDYETLENTDVLHRIHRDPNCCPSGGELWYRLKLELPAADAAPPLVVNSGNNPPSCFYCGSHAILLGGRAAADVALPRLVLDTARYVPPPAARITDE